MLFRRAIKNSFADTWAKISVFEPDHFRYLNESVYRYWFIQSLLDKNSSCEIQEEWRRIDLLLDLGDKQCAVEFKFYDARPQVSLTGKISYKGFAGDKNCNEFLRSAQCLTKLYDATWYDDKDANISELFIVLICTRRLDPGSNTDFISRYKSVESFSADSVLFSKIAERKKVYSKFEVLGRVYAASR